MHRQLRRLCVVYLLLLTPLSIAGTRSSGRAHTAKPSKPHAFFASDDWLGGTGNWSVTGNWSNGLPVATSDVFIGVGNDLVTLDMDTAINSITLGTGVGSSVLQGDGSSHTLLISGSLSVGSAGTARFAMNNVSVGADSWNAGAMDLQGSTTLKLAGNLDNSGVLTTHSSQDCWPFCEDSNQLVALGNINNTGSLGIYGSDSLTVKGTLTNAGELFVGNSALDISIARLVNTGTATLSPGRDTNLNIAEVWNSGTLYVPNGYSRAGVSFQSTTNTATGSITVTNGGSAFGRLINDGSINLSYGNSLADDVTNRGSIKLDYRNFYAGNIANYGTLFATTNSYVSAATLKNYGTITLADALAQIEVNGKVTNGSAALISVGGWVGMVSAPELENAGTIRIGSESSFTVGSGFLESGYLQTAGGVLDEVIGASYFGVITADDAADLDGTLRILLADGFVPELGSTYKFLYFAPGELTGQFALVEDQYFNNGTEMWEVLYDSDGGFVELTAVPSPEPASLALLGGGLLAAAAGCKRKLG